MQKIMRCPLCRGIATPIIFNDNVTYIECGRCWLTTELRHTTYRAVKLWNDSAWRKEQREQDAGVEVSEAKKQPVVGATISIDHEYTQRMTCPYCGYANPDSEEHMSDADCESVFDTECESCEKTFQAHYIVAVCWTTEKKPEASA